MWYMHLPFRIKKYQRNNERNLARIRKKDKITVVFFASNVAMWQYQHLYDAMLQDKRYCPLIVLSPLYAAYDRAAMVQSIQSLREYFKRKSVSYIDYDIIRMQGADVMSLKPDLMFYPQPYYTIMVPEHRYYKYNKSLLAIYSYGFHYRHVMDFYKEDYFSRAWKLFFENSASKDDFENYGSLKGRNVEIVGYHTADDFLGEIQDVWKKQKEKKKRIIWAPHFTITGDGLAQNSEFLNIAYAMLLLKDKYSDKVQFAFKPHPRLQSELYRHPNWGKEKTDKYYSLWSGSDNCQLESGEYVDLFMTSDAMIHDSGSFAAEYMFTGKPVFYTSRDMKHLYSIANECGKLILDNHYNGNTIEEIENFIINVVLGYDDPLRESRIRLRNLYLMPPNGKSVAANTMKILNKELARE